MATSLIQFRYEDKNRILANRICEELGIDLQTYMRLALNRLIQENGIPFTMKLNQKIDIENDSGIKALRACQRRAEEAGISEMSLDEINAEIDAVRKQHMS